MLASERDALLSGCCPLRVVRQRLILLPCRRHRSFRNLLHLNDVIWLVKNDPVERIELALPRGLLNCSACVGITRFPASANARRAEVNILGVILVVETRRQQ